MQILCTGPVPGAGDAQVKNEGLLSLEDLSGRHT